MSPIRATLLAVALSLPAASAAQAVLVLGNGDVASLTTILNSADRKVRVGDKLFTFAPLTTNSFSSANISLAGYIAANPLDGVGFELTGGLGDLIPGDADASRLVLSYTAEVAPDALASGYRIKDAGLVFNGSAHGQGSSASATESIFDFATGAAVSTLNTSASGSGASNLQDRRDFSPQSFAKVSVTTDLSFLAAGTGGSASASFIRQSFSQALVPAPATAAMGLLALGAARRRRR